MLVPSINSEAPASRGDVVQIWCPHLNGRTGNSESNAA